MASSYPAAREPAGGWRWIAGEPWVYTKWDAGEPNDTYLGGWGKDATGQSEERLQYHHNGTHWNDLPDDHEVVTPRFIVEWDVPTNVNDRVTFEPIESTFRFTPDTTGCPVGFVGTFSFEARLTNTSASSLSNLVVEVTEFTGGNLLQNADGGPGGVGAQLTVPQQDGLTDGILSPDEFVDVSFLMCLTEREPFSFMVDVLGGSAPTCVQPPESLTSWWPGDGSTEDLIGNRDAVLRDDATFGSGLIAQAFSLDGDGDFIDVPHDPALNVGTGDFTVDLTRATIPSWQA